MAVPSLRSNAGSSVCSSSVTSAFADDIYADEKAIDGNDEPGSTTATLAKVLKNRGYIGAYAFARSIDEVVQWLVAHGPVCWGTRWDFDMETPSRTGLIHPGGGMAGGHASGYCGHLWSSVRSFDHSDRCHFSGGSGGVSCRSDHEAHTQCAD